MLGTNYYIDVVNVLDAIKQHPYGISILGIERTLNRWGVGINCENIEEIVTLAHEANLIEVHKTTKFTFYSPSKEE